MKKVSIIGIGMGTKETLTIEGKKAIEQAKLIIGAKRVIAEFVEEKQYLEEYRAEVIADKVKEAGTDYIAVLMSGDTGFYSGAKKLYELLKEAYEVRLIPGISSLSYFAAKAGVFWEDAKIVSIHGKHANLLQAVKGNKKTFVLAGGNLSESLKQLKEAGLGALNVLIGENLSYETERIYEGTVSELSEGNYEALAVMLIFNENPLMEIPYGILEECFVQGNVPITKSEVRAVTMSKLAIANHETVYDIGAGTGSVSIEMALAAKEGKAYAIEWNEKAVELIHANKEKFQVPNLEIIQGMAPDALKELPAPHAAFIGGSKGNLEAIMTLLLKKNPKVRIVINAITIETVGKTLEICKKLQLSHVEAVQVTVAKAKKMAGCHMMMGQNPVYVILAQK